MQVEVKDVGFGYSPFPHELSRERSISLQAKGLFAVYGSFVSVTDPTAWASEDYICDLCGGINVKTFRKYKRELLEAGWISQSQRHRENGQYTTLLITRYYHPSMNPNFSMKSTDDQKTVDRKTAVRKLVPQEQKLNFPTKNHTHQKTVVCASGEKMPDKIAELTQVQKDCVEWTIREHQRNGQLRNEVGLRCHLVKMALQGQLDTTAYERYASTMKNASTARIDALKRIEEYRSEAEQDPITAEFWKEQKKRLPALFA